MLAVDLGDNDSILWAGMENNYDLFTLVDLRTVGGALSSLCHYLGLKDKRTDYQQAFTGDDYRTVYLDANPRWWRGQSGAQEVVITKEG